MHNQNPRQHEIVVVPSFTMARHTFASNLAKNGAGDQSMSHWVILNPLANPVHLRSLSCAYSSEPPRVVGCASDRCEKRWGRIPILDHPANGQGLAKDRPLRDPRPQPHPSAVLYYRIRPDQRSRARTATKPVQLIWIEPLHLCVGDPTECADRM